MLELRHRHDRPELSEPREPGHIGRIGVVALERDRRHRPGIGAENQAAFPARPPPAIDVTGAQDPVAKHGADVAAVGPDILVVVGIRNSGCLQAVRETLARVLCARRDFALFTRNVGVAAQRHWFRRPGDTRIPGRNADRRRLRGRAHARERRIDVRRPMDAIRHALHVARNLRPGHRPRGQRCAHDAGVRQQSEIMAQARIARRDPRIRRRARRNKTCQERQGQRQRSDHRWKKQT